RQRKDGRPARAHLIHIPAPATAQNPMEHRFYTLDVFTTTRFEGNPLAVFTDGDSLSDVQMQAIAREMNLAESVFVQKPTDERALARLRIFTTREELRLAGHPVVGTWFLLAELGVVPAQEGGVHVMQETGAGVLPVEIRFKDGRPQRVTMTQTEAAFRPVKFKKAALAKSLGLSPKDFDPHLDPECVSTGIFNLMVPLRNRAALGKIAMNMFELRKLLGKNATMAYCFALGGNSKVFSRGMLPWEIYEDPATGSAAGSLGAYLVKHGKLTAGHTLTILQGEEMGRPSHIEVEVTQRGKKLVPRVSGAAVKVFEGTITI
ncbi:MAG: PhzF family phenazine biosynthesis protein, partial [Candidatus Acidiferrum sp.]